MRLSYTPTSPKCAKVHLPMIANDLDHDEIRLNEGRYNLTNFKKTKSLSLMNCSQ